MAAMLVWFSILVGAALWLIGAASRPRRWGNVVIGGIIVIGGLFAAWRNRQQLGRFALWVIIAVSSSMWLLSLVLMPRRAAVFLALLTGAGLWWMGTERSPVAKRLDGRSLTQALQDRIMAQGVRNAANNVLEGVELAGPVRHLEGRTVIPVTLPPGATVDQLPEAAVGSALAKRLPVADVDVVPNPKHADQATIVTHDEPKRDPFEVLAEVDNRWVYSGGEGYDPIPLGPCIDPVTGKIEVAYWDWYKRPHMLVAGSTGAGKTGLQHATFAEAAHRKHVQIVALDPEAVEFDAYSERALWVARGPKECYEGLKWVFDLMEQRREWLQKRGERFFKVGVHGPLVLVKIDELAGVALKAGYRNVVILDHEGEEISMARLADNFQGAMAQIAARARKWGIRLEVGTQQPAAGMFEDTVARNNFGVRIGMWMMEAVGTQQILGNGAPDCTAIPELKGAGWMLRTGERGTKLYVPMRGALLVPDQHVSDPDEALGVAAREIAHKTAHLRSERMFYEMEEAA